MAVKGTRIALFRNSNQVFEIGCCNTTVFRDSIIKL